MGDSSQPNVMWTLAESVFEKEVYLDAEKEQSSIQTAIEIVVSVEGEGGITIRNIGDGATDERQIRGTERKDGNRAYSNAPSGKRKNLITNYTKEKANQKPVLYTGIALTKITDDSFVALELQKDAVTNAPLSSVNISIPQLIQKVNPFDRHYLKDTSDSLLALE